MGRCEKTPISCRFSYGRYQKTLRKAAQQVLIDLRIFVHSRKSIFRLGLCVGIVGVKSYILMSILNLNSNRVTISKLKASHGLLIFFGVVPDNSF